MTLRLFRRIRIAPGLRVNLSLQGSTSSGSKWLTIIRRFWGGEHGDCRSH